MRLDILHESRYIPDPLPPRWRLDDAWLSPSLTPTIYCLTNVDVLFTECLQPSSRKAFYMCAPNDVWSLGVILVNLTCGRNPWKQASYQDSTYRAFARSPDFLKTILPLSDELNDILGRIFNPTPEYRITLPELRTRILACSHFTIPTGAAVLTPPATPDHYAYVSPEEAIIDDCEYDSPLSPASSLSDDDGSLTSSDSSVTDPDEEFIQDCGGIPSPEYSPVAFESEAIKDHPAYHVHEFVPQQYTGPIPQPSIVTPSQHPVSGVTSPQNPSLAQAPIPTQAPCPSKSFFPLWDFAKYVQQVPATVMPHHTPFHQQVSFLPSFQGCY